MTEDLRVETDHNVYILGAGFSIEAGIPAVAGFLDAVRDSVGWLASQPGREAEVEAVRQVLRFRHLAAAASDRVLINVDDIEELFSLASATPGDQEAAYVTTAIAATIDYCRSNEPTETWSIDTPLDEGATEPAMRLTGGRSRRGNNRSTITWDDYEFYAAVLHGEVSERSPGRRNTVITFNYDTILEEALTSMGLPFDYRIGTVAPTANKDTALPILKMHGSVNWAKQNGGLGGPLLQRDDYAAVRASREEVAIVPPTWRKEFGGGLSQIWDASVEALRGATRLVIIGFSIPPTDAHFKYLLAAGLRDNISLRRIIFVNPAAANLQDRLDRVFRRELFGLFVESRGGGSPRTSSREAGPQAVRDEVRTGGPTPSRRAVETAGPVDKLQGELAHRPLDNPAGCPQSPQPPRLCS